MLKKLLKYDLKWIYKVLIVFYVIVFVFSVIGRAFDTIENSAVFFIVSQITLGIAVSMMVSSLINCIMRLWARFIKNLYKDESYLTHTLPVEKKTIYNSKVISAIVSIFITGAIIISCLFICYYSKENIEAIKTILELAASTYNTSTVNLLLLVSTVIIMQIMLVAITGYVAIILGYKSNKNKMLNTIIIGFGLYMLTQIISISIIGIIGLLNPNIMNLINTTETIDINSMKALMYGAIGLYAIYIIFYYVLGKRAFEKGVNVE